MTLKPKIAQYVTEIVAALQNAGYEAYIVGGAVRDFLLDRQPKDYDLSTSATPEEIKRVFRKQRCMIIGRRFRLVHLYHGKEILEISTFRKKPEHGADAPAKMNPMNSEPPRRTHGGVISRSTLSSTTRSMTRSSTIPDRDWRTSAAESSGLSGIP